MAKKSMRQVANEFEAAQATLRMIARAPSRARQHLPRAAIRAALEREREQARQRVEGSAALKDALRFMPAARGRAEALATQLREVRKNRDLTDEARLRIEGETKAAALTDIVAFVRQFDEAEERLLGAFTSVPAEAKLTDAEASIMAGLGPVLRDLKPETFLGVLEGAIHNRQRGLVAILTAVGEQFLDRKHYRPHEDDLRELVDLGQMVAEDPSVLASQHAEQVAAELRGDVQFFASMMADRGEIDATVVDQDIGGGRTVFHAFVSRLGDDAA
jgi:hypothetical protein